MKSTLFDKHGMLINDNTGKYILSSAWCFFSVFISIRLFVQEYFKLRGNKYKINYLGRQTVREECLC